MEIIKGQHYHIKDIGDKVELTSTLFQGIIAGITDLVSNGYNIIYQTATVRGNMYIITADKPKDGKNEVNKIKDQIEQTNEKLVKENRTLKSHLSRAKNKIKKLEEIKE